MQNYSQLIEYSNSYDYYVHFIFSGIILAMISLFVKYFDRLKEYNLYKCTKWD
jgi:hypothetical protein